MLKHVFVNNGQNAVRGKPHLYLILQAIESHTLLLYRKDMAGQPASASIEQQKEE